MSSRIALFTAASLVAGVLAAGAAFAQAPGVNKPGNQLPAPGNNMPADPAVNDSPNARIPTSPPAGTGSRLGGPADSETVTPAIPGESANQADPDSAGAKAAGNKIKGDKGN